MYETALVAPELVAGGVDAFDVSGGVIDRLVTGLVKGVDDADGLNVGAAAAVKQMVDVPVIAVGRIHDPRRPNRSWPMASPTSSRWAAPCSPTRTCPTS